MSNSILDSPLLNNDCGESRIVQDWLGMHSCDGSYGLPHTRTLAIDNDNGKTFDDIASIIEERASELFRE